MASSAAQPILSIVTPVLNADATLGATIESVRDLRTPDIEHVIVDGGSTDNTLQIIKSFESPRQTVLHDNGTGISNALNCGISGSSGKFLLIQNADDTLCAGALDTLVPELRKHTDLDPPTVYYGNAVQYDPATDRRFPRTADLASIRNYMSLYHGALVISRSVHDLVGLYDTGYHLAMDVEFVHRCIASNVSFKSVPSVLSNMRLRGRSHERTAEAMAEFERSVVTHRLQSVTLARMYRVRQTLLHTMLKQHWFQRLWSNLSPIRRISTNDASKRAKPPSHYSK